LFAALRDTEGQLIFCYPNSDAGSRELIQRTRQFLAERGNGKLFVNLDTVTYWSLLRQAEIFLGNSSSGIMETASFAVPTVNIGDRQSGRERAANIIDTSPEREAILAAITRARSEEFRNSLQGMKNLYGDGTASETIVNVLASAPIGKQLLRKRAVPLRAADAHE
jgi:UDP-N-acetylglucosamine 2-epimerase (non-hydrolysing)/GDP/UDP-N,N'-diacetylbacillosamine 2-epimerase (hydrolysing)